MDIYTTDAKKTNFLKTPTFSMIVAGIVLFLGALCFVPEAGFLRTLPILVVCGALSSIAGAETLFCLVVSVVFNFSMYLFRGSHVGEALLFAVLSVLMVLCGIYVSRLVLLYRKTEKKAVKKKCILYSAYALIAIIAANAILCGNIISFAVADSGNTKYISQNYKDTVDKKFTAYSLFDGQYKTYIGFVDGDTVVGDGNDCYISRKNGKLTDGRRDFFEDGMLEAANRMAALVVSGATDAFEITESDIDFADGEILNANSDISEYHDRVGYVISFYSIVEDKEDFVKICHDSLAKFREYDYPYSEIVFCAGNASDVLFSMTVKPDTELTKLSGLAEEFEDNSVSHYGIDENTVLEYWYNK